MEKYKRTSLIISVIVLLLVGGTVAFLFTPGDARLQRLVSSEPRQSSPLLSTDNSVKQDQETRCNWWDWFREYRVITDARERAMGRVIMDSFD
jgi:hypothetical protein